MNRELQKTLAVKTEEISVNYRTEQEQQFEERLNLLSEENQVLFEQVEAYKVQFEALSKTYEDKMQEMTEKISKFDELHNAYESAVQQLQEFAAKNEYLERRLNEFASGVIIKMNK
jgi:uncharacterized phage infection (PIP) family protein YhgE